MARTKKHELMGDRGVFSRLAVRYVKEKSRRYNKGLRHSRKAMPDNYALYPRRKIAESLWEL